MTLLAKRSRAPLAPLTLSIAALICAVSAPGAAAGTVEAQLSDRIAVSPETPLSRPEVECAEPALGSTTLRFTADEMSRLGAVSAFVRVPDTGKVDIEVVSCEYAETSAANESPDARQVASSRESADPEPISFLTVSEPAIMRDVRLVRLVFSPTANQSRSGRYAEELVVTVRTTDEPGRNELEGRRLPPSEAFERLYRGTVVNYEATEEGSLQHRPLSGRDPSRSGAEYLVIAADTYADEVQPLVEWKNMKGVPSMLVTLSSAGSTAGEIKSYIQSAYDTWEIPPVYVLLVGDTEQLPTYESLAYTDNYYATLAGADYLADVMVGRLSADTGSQCATEVAKILGYERTPVTSDPDWPTSALLMVHDDFDTGDWIYYMNTFRIYDVLDAAGFAPVDTLFKRNDVSRSQVYASVNDGRGFLNFRGQAWINWLEPFDISASYITSGWKLPIVVSATCATGIYEQDGFICEDWVRAGTSTSPKGSVAFFATNTAFEGSPELSLRRGYVDEGFFDGIFEDGGRTLGEGCLAGKMRMYLKTQDQTDYEGWNLLGDPEMNVWTSHPYALSVLHDGGTQIGPSSFVVTVLSGGSLHEGALVACVKEGEVYATGYTDVSGQVSLPIAPSTTGPMSVVVTDENAIPYEGTVLVLESGPFLTYSDIAVQDEAIGNGDEHLNTGETSDLTVKLANIGNVDAPNVTARLRVADPEVTVIDSVADYGDIAAGESAWGLDAFSVVVDAGCENGTLVPYSVAVYMDGEPAGVLNPAPLSVVTADLRYASMVCDDDGPGADGDGSPSAGETVGLSVTLENVGPSALTDVTGTLSSTDPRVRITTSTTPFSDVAGDGECSNAVAPFIVSVSPTATSGHVVPLTLVVSGDGQTYDYTETIEFDVVLTGSSVAAPVGPDAYGYYAYDMADSAYGPAPGFDWYDISPPGPGNLVTAITDEDAGVTSMGTFFPIRFYGESERMISICSNGYVAAGVTDYRFGDNTPIPNLLGPPNMMAPFWDDLDPSAGGDIYIWMDLINHRLIIQFDEVRHWHSQLAETFQVIIYNENFYPTPTDDCPIVFQYETVSMPDSCTVGIENYYQNEGLQYLYNSSYTSNAAPITSGSAILFTTVPPTDPDVTWLTLSGYTIDDSSGGNGDGLVQPGETVELTLELASSGGTSATDVSVELNSNEPMLSVVDGSADFPDISPGGSETNRHDALSFLATDTVPDTVATLWATVSANGGAYTGNVRMDIHIDLSSTGVGDAKPASFALAPGRPNPFSDDTRLTLALPHDERVVARLYSPSGRLVRTLADSRLTAGEHTLVWNGRDERGVRVASGVYFLRVVAGSDVATRKVVLLR